MKEPKRYTVEEIRAYILAQDSLGDVLHFLSEANIDKANLPEERDDDEAEITVPEDPEGPWN